MANTGADEPFQLTDRQRRLDLGDERTLTPVPIPWLRCSFDRACIGTIIDDARKLEGNENGVACDRLFSLKVGIRRSARRCHRQRS
jgi:hypothetical protein